VQAQQWNVPGRFRSIERKKHLKPACSVIQRHAVRTESTTAEVSRSEVNGARQRETSKRTASYALQWRLNTTAMVASAMDDTRLLLLLPRPPGTTRWRKKHPPAAATGAHLFSHFVVSYFRHSMSWWIYNAEAAEMLSCRDSEVTALHDDGRKRWNCVNLSWNHSLQLFVIENLLSTHKKAESNETHAE